MAETYKGHKPGSRKAQVHKALDKDGEKAAIALGASLGLAASTVKSWIGSWGRTPQPVPVKETATVPNTKIWGGKKKNRVHLIGHPDLMGTITEEGDEQSEVRWDNGNRLCVVNKWLIKVETGE